MTTASIIFVLSFISCTAAHVTNLPNQESSDPEFTWAPKNSDDDLEDFRSVSQDRLPAAEEFNEIKGEYDMNDVDFGNEDDGYYDFISIRNNKRSPNSVSDRSYKNRAGYYLIENPDHTVSGTTDIKQCNKYGLFQAGRINGVPFLKNKASGRYLAINCSGQVYTRPDRNEETKINHLAPTPFVYMYRNLRECAKATRRYLDISTTSRTVTSSEAGNTTEFQVRLGTKC